MITEPWTFEMHHALEFWFLVVVGLRELLQFYCKHCTEAPVADVYKRLRTRPLCEQVMCSVCDKASSTSSGLPKGHDQVPEIWGGTDKN